MQKFALGTLWLLVISSGILAGGSIFERVVLTPMWASAPPLSVTGWSHGAVQAPFFKVVTPTWALLSLATFVLSFWMPGAARPWARVAGVVGVGIMIWTAAFFIPLVMKLMAARGAGLSGSEITRLTGQWLSWGLLRTVILLGGWLAALRALVLTSPSGGAE